MVVGQSTRALAECCATARADQISGATAKKKGYCKPAGAVAETRKAGSPTNTTMARYWDEFSKILPDLKVRPLGGEETASLWVHGRVTCDPHGEFEDLCRRNVQSRGF
eukprot:s2036_g10.t1